MQTQFLSLTKLQAQRSSIFLRSMFLFLKIHHSDALEDTPQVRASVGTQDIAAYIEWNKQYGSFPVEQDAS
jgi:hypothetical protein